MVNVTKSNFLAQLGDFLQHLPSSSFVAIDEEMTGISLPGSRGRPNKIELPGERYARLLKGVPERYSILQVGVALFHKNPNYGKKKGKEEKVAASHRGTAGEDDDGEEAEHAYMHREGMLNQDELETVTEREEEDEILAAAENGANDGGNDGVVETEYVSRTYNFYLFPDGGRSSAGKDREVTMNPSTVKFLLDNGMDFDKVFREGISYATVDGATYLKDKHFAKYDNSDEKQGSEMKPGAPSPLKRKVKLTRVEDIAFVARTMADLREWIDSDSSLPGDDNGDDGTDGRNDDPNGEEGSSLVLPPCNAFLRRCLYETIEDEYPDLVLERADANLDPAHRSTVGCTLRNQIRAVRLSPAERERKEKRARRAAWDGLLMNMGFATVFKALSDACNGKSFTKERTEHFLEGTCAELSIPVAQDAVTTARKIPLVVHNGLQDLMFLMTHCHGGELPESFEGTKGIIRGYFPNVYDTKVIGTEYSDAIIRGGSTALQDLYEATCNVSGNSDDTLSLRIPPIVNQDGDGKSQGQAHEAGWDAYMTGCAFHALCDRILESKNHGSVLRGTLTLDALLHDSSDSLLREWLGANLLYMHASLYTIDLESTAGPAAGLHDPLSAGLSIDTTFHVSGITTSVSTRDILQALTSGNESEDEEVRTLQYEIIWVDDASFFVGTRTEGGISPNDVAATVLIASHVRNKLRGGLGDVDIASLGQYFARKHDAASSEEEQEPVGIVGSLVAAAAMPFLAIGGVLGLSPKKRPSDGSDGGQGEGPAKRMRLG